MPLVFHITWQKFLQTASCVYNQNNYFFKLFVVVVERVSFIYAGHVVFLRPAWLWSS